MYSAHCLLDKSVSMYCLYVNYFCTVWSTRSRISLTKTHVLWSCDNKSDLIVSNREICQPLHTYIYIYIHIYTHTHTYIHTHKEKVGRKDTCTTDRSRGRMEGCFFPKIKSLSVLLKLVRVLCLNAHLFWHIIFCPVHSYDHHNVIAISRKYADLTSDSLLQVLVLLAAWKTKLLFKFWMENRLYTAKKARFLKLSLISVYRDL